MKKRRTTSLLPLGQILGQQGDLRLPAEVDAAPIPYREWEIAVGSRIAERARPMRLERGTLTIRTATSTWAQELSLLSEEILTALRKRGIEVHSLRFWVGPVEAPARPPMRREPRRAPPVVKLPANVAWSIANVRDQDLREAIATAASKNLGWQAINAATEAPVAKGREREREQEPSISRSRGAPAPRSVAAGSAPQGRSPTPSPEEKRRKRGRA